MQAMVLEAIAPIESSPLKQLDVPPPRPGPGEVLVKVRACATCRTDLHVIEGDLPRNRLPIIPGHQVVGVVEQLGPDCKRLAVGQRVGIAWLRYTCGACEYCAGGRENLCLAQRFTGYHADGGYAEYAIVHEDFAYVIPEAFSDVDAAPLLCAGIVGYRALRRANLPDGGKLAIFGFGSSAHVIMQIALHHGCQVYVISRGENHLHLAKDMGAAWVGHDAAEMPHKVDAAINFAPVGHLVPPALEMIKPGGTLSLAGIHMTDVPTLNYERHLFYERDVHSVTANTRDDGRALLEEAARIPIRPHVTTYPLEDANRALQDMKSGRQEGTGVMVVG